MKLLAFIFEQPSYLFILLTECLPKVGTFMRIILSDPAKSGLEGGAWINEYEYQDNDKTITIMKNRVCYFSMQSIIAKPM